VSAFSSAIRGLRASWGLLWPLFAALVAWNTYERACLTLAEPWPWMTGRPLLALLVGLVYVAAHWWVVIWLLTLVRIRSRAGEGASASASSLAAVWPSLLQVVLMAAAMAVEYAPMGLWRWLGWLTRC
jgi:hypothetical protein